VFSMPARQYHRARVLAWPGAGAVVGVPWVSESDAAVATADGGRSRIAIDLIMKEYQALVEMLLVAD